MVPDTSSYWDLPETPVTNSYFLCTAPRSGSNLLAFTLAEQGIGIPLEYLNLSGNPKTQDFLVRMLNIPDGQTLNIGSMEQLIDIRSRYLKAIQNNRTTANGFFGVKLFSNHLKHLFPEIFSLKPLCSLLSQEPKFIHLYRQDICSMAISLHFAQHRQQWHSSMNQDNPDTSVPYDFNILLRQLRTLDVIQKSWFGLLKDVPKERVYSVSYSSLTNDFTRIISEINTFLGVSDTTIPQEPIQRQQSLEKEQMVLRFKHECKLRQPWIFDVNYTLNNV